MVTYRKVILVRTDSDVFFQTDKLAWCYSKLLSVQNKSYKDAKKKGGGVSAQNSTQETCVRL